LGTPLEQDSWMETSRRRRFYLSILLLPFFVLLVIFIYSLGAPPPPPPVPVAAIAQIRPYVPAPRTFALFSAYTGDSYEVFGSISSQSKKEYAQFHGYDFYVDNDLFSLHSASLHSWQDKAAIRTKGFKRHLADHQWAWWTDVDIVITNATIRLEDVVALPDVDGKTPPDEEFDMVVSKDWGGRQVQTGSVLIRGSSMGRQLVEWWEEGIIKHEEHDDLRGFEKMLQLHPEAEKRIKWVPQKVLNSYPHIVTDSYNLMKDNGGHDIWKEGDFVVHIVNCLRTRKTYECYGIASEYLYRFRQSAEKLIRNN